MVNNYLIIFFSAFLVAILATNLLGKISVKTGFLLLKGIPLVGGMAIGVSYFLISVLCIYFFNIAARQILGIVTASLIMLIFGVVDDKRELSVRAKFLFQLAAAILLVFFGIRTNIAYIGEPLNILITLIWVIGITNAINHLDIIDGLAGGTALIVTFSLFLVSLLNGQIDAVILNLALAGAISGFLIYNFPPARVYMGNSGSHFIGFVLAAIALIISYAPLERKTALISPLLILGLPILDTFFLILIRMGKKKSVFKKSDDHLALRFLEFGYSKTKTLLILLIFVLFFCLAGLTVAQAGFFLSIIIIILAVLVSLFLTLRMSKVKVND